MLLALQLLNLLEAEAGDDEIPDAFSFVDQVDVALSSTITSAPVTITGIDVAVTFTADGGTIDVNGDEDFQASRDVSSGDQIRARGTSSGQYLTAGSVVVTGGGVSDTFTFTTISRVVDRVLLRVAQGRTYLRVAA